MAATSPTLWEWLPVEGAELPDNDSVLDHALTVDHNFLLLLALTQKGDVISWLEEGGRRRRVRRVPASMYREAGDAVAVRIAVCMDAEWIALLLADCSIRVLPTRMLLDVEWPIGRHFGDSTLVQFLRDEDSLDVSCLRVPTSIVCFYSSHSPRRPYAAIANKAGQIFVVDLALRQLTIELGAPQSIHRLELLRTARNLDLLVSGCTGVQWLVPLESREQSLRETLTALKPSALTQLVSASQQVLPTERAQRDGRVYVLDTTGSRLSLFHSVYDILSVPLRSVDLPAGAWHATTNEWTAVALSADSSTLQTCIHLGLASPSWSDPLPSPPPSSDGCRQPYRGVVSTSPLSFIVICDRSLLELRVTYPKPSIALAAHYLFWRSDLSPSLVDEVAKTVNVSRSELCAQFVPTVLSASGGRLRARDLSRLVGMASVLKVDICATVDVFSEYQLEEHLLPELLRAADADDGREARARLLHVFARRATSLETRPDADEAIASVDSELSDWLSRHPAEGASGGAAVVAVVSRRLWRSSSVLLSRCPTDSKVQSTAAETLVAHANPKNALALSPLLLCASSLHWPSVDLVAADRLLSVLSDWTELAADEPPLLATLLSIARSLSQQSKVQHVSVPAFFLLAAIRFRAAQVEKTGSSVGMSAMPVACGPTATVVVDEQRRLLHWGQRGTPSAAAATSTVSSSAAATNGDGETRTEPNTPNHKATPAKSDRKTESVRRLADHRTVGKVVAVALGSAHVLVLNADGDVFAEGDNTYGQCGVGSTESNIPEITKVNGDWTKQQASGSVRQLSTGHSHSAVVTSDGRVHLWGWTLYGQCGIEQRRAVSADLRAPYLLPPPMIDVTAVSCGRVHTVLLTRDGRVWTTGGGMYGQLGDESDIRKRFQFEPVRLDGGGVVSLISTHFYHTLAATSDGRIHVWGANPHDLKMKMFVMRRLAQQKREQRAASALQSVAQNEQQDAADGSDRAIGSTDEKTTTPPEETAPPAGGLELGKAHLKIDSFQLLLDNPTDRVAQLATGLAHSALLTEQGRLYTWGKSLDHQLGHGQKLERSRPVLLNGGPPDSRFAGVACGSAFTLAWTRDGAIYAWGNNDVGQCGPMATNRRSSAEEATGSSSATAARKYFFKSKEGTRRCILLPDSSRHLARPTALSGAVRLCAAAQQRMDDQSEAEIDREMESAMRSAPPVVLQSVSRRLSLSARPAPLLCVVLLHLLVQDVLSALRTLRLVRLANGAPLTAGTSSSSSSSLSRRQARRATVSLVRDYAELRDETGGGGGGGGGGGVNVDPTEALTDILVDLVASSEQLQQRVDVLGALFCALPADSRHWADPRLVPLLPLVWTHSACADDLFRGALCSATERAHLLADWQPPNTLLAGRSVPVMAQDAERVATRDGQLRLWTRCGHVVPIGQNEDVCSVCASNAVSSMRSALARFQ